MLATKAHAAMSDDDPNASGNSRRWIIRECDNSLRRLGTDYIDLYQIHRPDPTADVDETLGALTDLIRAGKIRYPGSSTFPPSQIVAAQWTAERRGRERFVCEQPPYSILVREIERSVLPACRRYGMGVIPWSPLAGGYLTGRYRKGGDIPSGSRLSNRNFEDERERAIHERRLDAVEELLKVAADAGVSVTHLAMAFVLEHPAVSAAIIGPRTMEQLDDLLAGVDVRLDADVLDRIDEIVPPGTSIAGADPWQPRALSRRERRRG